MKTTNWPHSVRRSDLRIEFMRGSGKGGQNKNKRDTACRITHLPTGLSVRAEEQRTQEANRRIAFERLAAQLVPLMKAAVSSGRSTALPTDEVRVYRAIDDRVRDRRAERQFSYMRVMDGAGLDEIHRAIIEG